MQIKQFFTLLLAVLVTQTSISQKENLDVCGTHEVSPWYDHYITHKDEYQFERPEEPLYIPLTVHILGTDEGFGYFSVNQTYDALCTLNEDFAASNIQFFVPEEFNYIDRTEWYNHAEYRPGYDMMNFNNVAGTVNCYIVQNPAGNCGYYAPAGDAVALSKGCMGVGDHTWAHELGHFFSLPHTFRGWEGIDYDPNVATSTYQAQVRRGIENVARTNCASAGDRFCETLPDYLSFRWPCNSSTKESIVQMTDLNGDKFRADGTLFMSYASDNCSSRFSTDQIDAMYANINTQRRDLLNNEAFDGEIIGEVEKIEPLDGAGVQYDAGYLEWSAVENATHYFVTVSRLPNLGGLLIVEDITTDTFVYLPELSLGRTYHWRVRAVNKFSYCSNPTDITSFIASALTNVNEEISESVNIWPNPVPTNRRTLIVDGDMELTRYSVYNLTGQRIHVQEFSKREINLPEMISKGSYFLRLETSEGDIVKKIIIE